MRKRSFISFFLLLVFWFVISQAISLQHIMVGIFLSLFTVWFWKDLNPKQPSILYPRELLLFGRCIIMLVGYIVKSNIDVAKTLLFSDLSVGSLFLELQTDIKSDWGRVFLAICVTITPGTIVVDFNPNTKIFAVHALTRETGVSLYYWRIITEIENLETLVQRRVNRVVDNGRTHGSNSISTPKSNNRSHRN